MPQTRFSLMRAGFLLLCVLLALLVIEQFITGGNRGRSRTRQSLIIASMQAAGIHKACMLYAQDHEGRFPAVDGSEGGASAAYRKLFPDAMNEEKPFYVPGSAWHDEARGKKPDNDIGKNPDFAQCLERGENHWAYVSGLTERSNPGLPLIADGFVEGKPGEYTDDPNKKGGRWQGTKAVVVYVSGAAKAENISAKNGFRVMKSLAVPGGATRSVDLFTTEGGLPPDVRVLNPW